MFWQIRLLSYSSTSLAWFIIRWRLSKLDTSAACIQSLSSAATRGTYSKTSDFSRPRNRFHRSVPLWRGRVVFNIHISNIQHGSAPKTLLVFKFNIYISYLLIITSKTKFSSSYDNSSHFDRRTKHLKKELLAPLMLVSYHLRW